MTTASKVSTVFSTGVSQEKDSFKAGQEAAKRAAGKNSDSKPQLAIVFASSQYKYAEVLKGIRAVAPEAQIIGCSSASEFTEEAVTDKSVVCALISSVNHKFFTAVGKNLAGDPQKAMKEAASELPQEDKDFPHRSVMLMIDALSGKGEEVCSAAVQALGQSMKICGGAAADNLAFKETVVFRNLESYSDAVAMCMMTSKTPVSIGVRHGHLAISQTMKLTKTKGNVVFEIDGKPALDVWKDATRIPAKLKGIDVDKLNGASEIGAWLMQYEAGLTVGHEHKVRAPLSVNPDGSINFACVMEQGAQIRVMESPNKACQIRSAKDAAEAALKSAKGKKLAGAIVFDCICRNLILDKDFSKAIDEIKQVVGNIPIIGFATYGEIAMEPGQLSGFHNTTSVVLLIPE